MTWGFGFAAAGGRFQKLEGPLGCGPFESSYTAFPDQSTLLTRPQYFLQLSVEDSALTLATPGFFEAFGAPWT